MTHNEDTSPSGGSVVEPGEAEERGAITSSTDASGADPDASADGMNPREGGAGQPGEDAGDPDADPEQLNPRG